MLFRLRTQNFYIYYYQFYYILNIELFQNYNIKIAPISQYILQLFLGAFCLALHKVVGFQLVGSVLLYIKCTTQTDIVVAIVRIVVAAVSRWIDVAVVAVKATTKVPADAGP